MPEHEDERERGFELLFVGFLFLLVVVGLIFILGTESHFYNSVGEALLIAGVLGLTIDPFVKRRLLKESLRSVDKLLIGYGLPSELQDRIKEIMRTRAVRKPMFLHYHLIPVGNKQVKLITTVKYHLENICNEPYEFQQTLSAEKANRPAMLRLCCIQDDKTVKYCLNEQELQGGNFLHEDRVVLTARGEKLSIQPAHGRKDRYYEFYGKCSQILKDDHTDTFRLVIPDIKTIHIIITAEYPEQEFTFGTTLKAIENPENPDKTTRWEGDRAFFTNETISIWWEPKQKDAQK